MFDDLIETWQELGNMLSDVQENHTDMHPSDVVGVLGNAMWKAMDLTQALEARRKYILTEVLPNWTVTQSGQDAGMPPAKAKTTQPLPVIKEGTDIG
jgi:hypothetical protein